MDNTICPYCSYPVAHDSIVLWDGQRYCWKCVNDVSPLIVDALEKGKRLQDVISRTDASVWKCLYYLGRNYFLFISILFGILGAIAIVLGKEEPMIFVFLLLFFVGGGLIFLFLLAALIWAIEKGALPRVVSVERDGISVTTGDCKLSLPLKECEWTIGSTQYDRLCWFTHFRRGIIVQTERQRFACGLNAESHELWRAFLTLARVPYNPSVAWFKVLLACAVSGLTGGLIGWVIGSTFLGIVDGLFIGGIYSTMSMEGMKAARQRLHPIALMLGFATVALMMARGAAMATVISYCGLNGLLGLAVGLHIRVLIAAREDERKPHFT